MTTWDERYNRKKYVYGTEPNEFLVSEARRIPKGRVLSLAEGEGRNATYLARLGYAVHAMDGSAVGLKKALKLAAARGVTITREVADLSTYTIEHGHWQGIVSIFAHVPPFVRKAVHRQVVQGLAPGGVFLLEAFTLRQLALGGFGGPGRYEPELFMSQSELRVELSGLALQIWEVDREVNEGLVHYGLGAVVQVIGVKPA